MNYPISARAALSHAIDHIERLQNGKGWEEPVVVARLPHADLAVRLALRSAIARRRLTCFVSESFSPDQAALQMLCAQAKVSLQDLTQRNLGRSDFNRLTFAAAKISTSSIHFTSPSTFYQAAGELLDLEISQGLHTVVCERRTDSNLDAWREAFEFVSRMTGAEIHLVTGRLPAAGRFIPGFLQRV
jgi:hypothetical protein